MAIMEISLYRRNTRGMVLFGIILALCAALTGSCVYLALSERGQPWGGFAYNAFGQVMKGYDTDLVFFDMITAINGRQVRDHGRTGANIRERIHQVPAGTPLTYQIQRGQAVQQVTVPVQITTWRRLAVEFGIPLLVALGQLGMGVLVFLLRPNTKRSWIFLGFCVPWFGLFVTLFDFQSTQVFTQLFLFCWFMTSAVLLHLAFVFPEDRPLVRRYPSVQYLFYLPSLALWGFDQLTKIAFSDFYYASNVGLYLAYVHAVYWMAALLILLASLIGSALRATSAVARNRAVTVFCGFAAGFIIPMVSESMAILLHVNLPLEFVWLLTLLLPLSITYAILRYNLFDVGMIVRRTLTYGVLTGLVIGSYLLLVWFFNALLRDAAIAQARGFPVLFGLGVLFGLNPLRARIQRGLDRLFFRTKYDFRQTIETLSQDLTALLDPDEIARRIVTTVTTALNVSNTALYLADASNVYHAAAVQGDTADRLAGVQPSRDHDIVELIARQRRGLSRYDLEAHPLLAQKVPEAAREFERLGISLALPLLFKDDLIGMLALGEKRSGALFTEEDLELLRTLTSQSAIALANARSYRSLEATNDELRAALRKVELLEHVKTHLGKFVPTAVRRIIELDPTAPALDKHDQDVTVLFLDIEGYTSMSEALDQEKVNYVVEHYFSSFLDDVYTNQGDINETAGDGLMIIFQHDDPHEHARAAVRTALAIRDKTRRINAELQGTYAPVTVNMGINSGIAAVGSTKFEGTTGTRWTFTASGPITNLAARIGAAASGGAIYIGEATAQRLSEHFILRDLGFQTFKNVREAVTVYEVLEQRSRADTVHTAPVAAAL
jgi:class 3 adenylate cyclase